MNTLRTAAIGESPPLSSHSDGPTLAHVSDRLDSNLVDEAAGAGQDVRPGVAQRNDGWTPERIRTFLETLATCGVVADAARAAGISARSAYKLRHSAKGRAFHLAWNAALRLARHAIADMVMSRAVHGCVEMIVRDGEVMERHRYDNRLTMAVLARLDRQVQYVDAESESAGMVANEFDQFVDIVCAGGEGAEDFIALRDDLSYAERQEAGLLARLDNYRRYRAGHAQEIYVSDVASPPAEAMKAEQRLRFEGAGLYDRCDREDEEDGEGADG